ncbi:LuxR C-terminal-related transcriptional regulator [Kitasatospora sp. NPDC094028]
MTTPPTADSPTPKRHTRPAAPDAAAQDAAGLPRKLTPREAQTLAHLAAGHDLTRTAAALGITPATARGHLHRAMRKLGVTTEAEAVALGAEPAGAGTEAEARPARAKAAPRPGTGTAGTGPARAGSPERRTAAGPSTGAPAGPDPKPRANPASAAERPGTAAAAAPGGAAKRRPAETAAAPPSHAVRAEASAEHGTAADTDERAEAMAKQSTAPDTGTRGAGAAADPAGARPTPVPQRRAAAAPAAGRAGRAAGGFEELYEAAHTRLVQQVFLLTACRHRAVHCVRLAFGDARRRWARVAATGDPEGWVRARASELALSPWHRGGPRRAHVWQLPHRRIKVRPADESQAVLPDHDRLTDRDRALLKALKRLSRPQRRALVLHDGLGLPAAVVAVEVESSRAAAEARVWAARTALAGWVPDLVGPDPAAPGFADGLSGLLHRAAVRGVPAPHRPPVPALRARYRLWTASRTGAAALLTMAVGGATLATLAGIRPAVLTRPPEPPAPALCVPAADAAEEPGVPVPPGGGPNVISSLWCSPSPGLAAVLVEPQQQAQAAARWTLVPHGGRGAAAPPPQGPVACPPLTTRPCASRPDLG